MSPVPRYALRDEISGTGFARGGHTTPMHSGPFHRSTRNFISAMACGGILASLSPAWPRVDGSHRADPGCHVMRSPRT
jgi:hypothetical protein